jgi:hypothetical protein
MLSALILTVLLCGCKPERTSNRSGETGSEFAGKAAPPAAPKYALKDTLVAGGGPMEYYGTILYRDSMKVDTALTYFGIHEIGRDSVVYERLFIESDSMWNESHDTLITLIQTGTDSGIFLYDGARKKRKSLSAGLPYYGYFASPSLFSGSLLYWGVSQGDSGYFNIYAMRYGLKTGAIDSVYLFKEGLETDNSSFFAPVFPENGKYIYQGTESKVELDSGFRKL